jgi:hypothetical protein
MDCFTTPDPVGFFVCSCSEVVVVSASCQMVLLTLVMWPRLTPASECKSQEGSVAEANKLRAGDNSIINYFHSKY